MAKSFREFLDAQKKSTPDVKEKVNIASAGTTFYLNHIKSMIFSISPPKAIGICKDHKGF